MSISRARPGNGRGVYPSAILSELRAGSTPPTWVPNNTLWRPILYSLRYASYATCLLFGVILVVQGCIIESFYVPSTSMAPTLRVEDCIIVPKFAYGLRIPFFHKPIISWGSPDRGKVVVFHREDDPQTGKDESRRAVVKRVIGVGGDEVYIAGEHVFVNGMLQNEPYVRRGHRLALEPSTVTEHFTVPEGKVFVLGDNRDESDDSRFWRDPFVSVERIVGPAAAVYWSAVDSARMVY